MSGHRSHRLGVDADIRPVRCDAKKAGTNIRADEYDMPATQQLVDIFRQVCDVKVIFFNDCSVRGVRSWPGHENHLHVRLN